MPQRPRVNPNLLRAGRAKIVVPGGKFYKPAFSYHGNTWISRRAFKRAREAQIYLERVLGRWKRLYNWMQLEIAEKETAARIAALMKPKVAWWRRLLNSLLSRITSPWATKSQKTS